MPDFDAQLPVVWDFMERFNTVVGALTACFALMAWLKTTQLIRANREQQRRREAPITIRLRRKSAVEQDRTDRTAGDELTIPYKPRRDQLTRAELCGILGLYAGNGGFEQRLLFDILEDGTFDKVVAGKDLDSENDEILTIECPDEQFQRFQKTISGEGAKPPKEL